MFSAASATTTRVACIVSAINTQTGFYLFLWHQASCLNGKSYEWVFVHVDSVMHILYHNLCITMALISLGSLLSSILSCISSTIVSEPNLFGKTPDSLLPCTDS